MKEDEVPQDTSRTYGGARKLLYAVDARGEYAGVKSAGWEVETYATVAAIDELNAQRDAAWERARAGEASPLEYHMLTRRMDLPTLADAAGLWRWRVRRHFRADLFARLPERLIARYADALGLSPEELRRLPAAPGA